MRRRVRYKPDRFRLCTRTRRRPTSGPPRVLYLQLNQQHPITKPRSTNPSIFRCPAIKSGRQRDESGRTRQAAFYSRTRKYRARACSGTRTPAQRKAAEAPKTRFCDDRLAILGRLSNETLPDDRLTHVCTAVPCGWCRSFHSIDSTRDQPPFFCPDHSTVSPQGPISSFFVSFKLRLQISNTSINYSCKVKRNSERELQENVF